MKGLFVDSGYKYSQGRTDFGYYMDGGKLPGSSEELEKMVEEDEAFFVEIFPIQNSRVFIRLRSENRRFASELGEEIGIRTKGLNRTIYQSTGNPVLPNRYDNKEDRDEAIVAFAEYALEHGRGGGIEVDGVDWDSLLETD